ncbi:nucleotide sugar dehydrogenase [Tabrizicola aquatica]|uniref:nucleotide sugar dehydrogenase n=1 Tax=Tabrizicola aquatica TaxID=909926 RepID=UPI000CD23ACB|nr:nucleotide sugar dehydrogenase [Tabrizicola aquatica]
MTRLAVFGIGYVGVVSAACLARDGHQVIAVDVDPGKVAAINAGRSPIVERDLPELIAEMVVAGRLTATTDVTAAVQGSEASFVCVGTPSAADHSIGLDYVKAVCAQIGRALADHPGFHSVIMRSTIVPGTMEKVCIPILEQASGKVAGRDFGVGYYPEFLRESTAIRDYADPGLIVFGALDEPTGALLTRLNQDLPCDINLVDLPTAEMVKYTSNAWRAVKVSFANEIGNIAKAAGLDGQRVMSILCSDHKVSMSPHFLRPGFAFGGSCLPKDVRALRAFAADRQVASPLLDAVLVANAGQIRRAEAMIEASGKTRIGMVGISFKPGTDDLRESPLAELATRLIGRGMQLSVYDPYVHEAFASDHTQVGRGLDQDIELGSRLVGSIDDLIARSDIVLVGNRYDEAIQPLQDAMGNRPMVDLTRIKPGQRSDGLYEGICW